MSDPRHHFTSEKDVTTAVMKAAGMMGFAFKRRNVGMALGASGKPVRFNEPGQLDWYGRGPMGTLCQDREIELEIKREAFNPRKIYGKEKIRFAKQLGNMIEINRRGGFAVWVSRASIAMLIFRCLLDNRDVRAEFNPDGFYDVTARTDREDEIGF